MRSDRGRRISAESAVRRFIFLPIYGRVGDEMKGTEYRPHAGGIQRRGIADLHQHDMATVLYERSCTYVDAVLLDIFSGDLYHIYIIQDRAVFLEVAVLGLQYLVKIVMHLTFIRDMITRFYLLGKQHDKAACRLIGAGKASDFPGFILPAAELFVIGDS